MDHYLHVSQPVVDGLSLEEKEVAIAWVAGKTSWLQRTRQPINTDTDFQRMRVMEAGWRMYGTLYAIILPCSGAFAHVAYAYPHTF
jgi:hypothetical protein